MKRFPSFLSSRKQLILGFSLLMLSSLGGAAVGTFAWFEIEGGAEVSNIEINFAPSFSLEIGLKDRNGDISYYSSIDDDTLKKIDPDFESFAPLKEASSMYLSSWLTEDFDYENGFPTLYGPYYESGGASGQTLPLKDGFFQLETYFRSNENVYLFLDSDCEISPVSSINREREEEFGLMEGQLDEVVRVARVSFLSSLGYTIYSPGGSDPASFAGPLDIDGDGYYDHMQGKEILYGEYEGTPTHSPANPTPPPSPHTSFFAGHAPGVEILDPSSYTPAVERSSPLSELVLPPGAGAYDPSFHPLAKLPKNTPTRVLLTFYVEGWDKASTENIAYGAWSVRLAFSALQSA